MQLILIPELSTIKKSLYKLIISLLPNAINNVLINDKVKNFMI